MDRHDPDATVVVRRGAPAKPAPVARKRRWLLPVLAGAVVLAAGAVGAILLLSGPPAPVAVIAPPALSVQADDLPQRSEAEILAGRSDTLTIVRFAPNPRVVVLDFPTLTEQGRTFNRIAAFAEKRGLPRDRVLNDDELATAVRDDNSTVETYYYGHDYRSVEIVRFFAVADRQRQVLTPQEETLRALLTKAGLLAPGTNAAVISIPREGLDPFVDASGRFSLLRHELSHGEYFTNPEYAAFIGRFWAEDMTEADRAAFRAFLDRQGYDTTDEDLMANETQ